MGKYIGQDVTYGFFEKQTIPVLDPNITQYELNRSVPSATSIQVVCERATLEPNKDYSISRNDAGKSILNLHDIDLSVPADGELSLYVIFLGAKLLTPGSNDQNAELWTAIDNKADISTVHSYVDGKILNLINYAPAALDTLKELSEALGNDANYAATTAATISAIESDVENIDARVATLEQVTLAPVATSGSYNDLTDRPSLTTVATSGSYNDLTDRPSLTTVATSGSYNDLTDKPIHTTVLPFENLTTEGKVLENKLLSLTAQTSSTGDTAEVILPKVALTGSYTDIDGAPPLNFVDNTTTTSNPLLIETTTENYTASTNLLGDHTINKTTYSNSCSIESFEQNFHIETQNDTPQTIFSMEIPAYSVVTFEVTLCAKNGQTDFSTPRMVTGKLKFGIVRQTDGDATLASDFSGPLKEINTTDNAPFDFNVEIVNNTTANITVTGGPEEYVVWGANVRYVQLTKGL